MQPYMNFSHQQVSERLHALRQEAARARLVSGRPGLLARVLRFFGSRSLRPVSPQTSVRPT